MKASETPLQPVLEGSKQYVVPLFQRQFSWTKKDFEVLWDDLIELYEAEDGREHFLGAIVTMPIDMVPHGVNKYMLIDGQQRLTTLSLLLVAIRDLAQVDSSNLLHEQVTEQYLVNKWASEVNHYKLLPTQKDRKIFFQILNGEIKGQSGLVQAHRFFTRKLKGRDAQGLQFDLNRILNILAKQFVVVMITLAKDENPYLIFESLNAKGQPLTQADLVRNYLFMRIEDADEQKIAYTEFWKPMEKNLGDNLSNFMWRYLTKDGVFVRQSSIYEAIKNRLSSLASSAEIIDVLIDMHTYASYYGRLIAPEKEPNQMVSKRLMRLNRWEVSTSYPFLLALYHDYKKGYVTTQEFCTAIDIIESFVIRRFFCRIPTNALNRLFITLYDSLDKTDVNGSMESHLVTRDWPDDTTFLHGWENFPIYTSGTAKCRHILESLEEELVHNHEMVDVTHKRITIEHVMPQTLNEDWEASLGRESFRIHDTLLHTVGNLTLTGQNEPIGNQSFEKKAGFFRGSNFVLNKYFASVESWNEDAIRCRAQALGEIALQIWKRPQVNESELRRQDPTGYKPVKFSLLEQEYPVNSWRDMLLQTLGVLAMLHGSKEFALQATNVTGVKRQYVSYVKDEMANPAPIPGTDLWVETNLSSRSILSVIKRIVQECGHDESDFVAYWK